MDGGTAIQLSSRGAMMMRGLDPMDGPEFLEMFEGWNAASKPYCTPRRLGTE